MKIGFFQFDVVYGDKQANLDKVTQALLQDDFDLILLPELFSTGSIFLSVQHVHDFAEVVPEGETTQRLIALAQSKSAYIVAGIIEREGEHCYNSAVIVGPNGFIGTHRKVNLASSDLRFFSAGEQFNVFEILGRKVGVLLCYDIWFPQAAQTLVEQGVDIILNPSNFCGEDSVAVITQQAKVSGVYTIAANRLGMDHDMGTGVKFIGASLIISPKGEVLKHGGCHEALVMHSIV